MLVTVWLPDLVSVVASLCVSTRVPLVFRIITVSFSRFPSLVGSTVAVRFSATENDPFRSFFSTAVSVTEPAPILWVSTVLRSASAMFPLFLVLFGVGDETKISVAAFGAILVILFNVAYGVMNARKTRLLAAKVMGASRLRVLFDVMLLESLPQTFVGLRNGVSLALVIIVVAEMFIGSQDGLGHSVFEAQQLFDMPRMYAAIFAAGVLGYGLNLLFLLVERRFVHWSGK